LRQTAILVDLRDLAPLLSAAQRGQGVFEGLTRTDPGGADILALVPAAAATSDSGNEHRFMTSLTGESHLGGPSPFIRHHDGLFRSANCGLEHHLVRSDGDLQEGERLAR
jgi:hypothetical protein